MTNKMNVAACLVVGMMTISTVVAPSATHARTVQMSQTQAKISTEAVGQFQRLRKLSFPAVSHEEDEPSRKQKKYDYERA